MNRSELSHLTGVSERTIVRVETGTVTRSRSIPVLQRHLGLTGGATTPAGETAESRARSLAHGQLAAEFVRRLAVAEDLRTELDTARTRIVELEAALEQWRATQPGAPGDVPDDDTGPTQPGETGLG